MELSFVANAIRRRPWIVVLCMLLGLLPGLIGKANSVKQYESLAVVLVSPPSEGQSFAIGTGTDRYVENQLSVLQGTLIAERVATDVGGALSRSDVQKAVRIVREPGTDLVDVFATDDSADRAQLIAQQYVTIYLDDQKTRAKETQQDELDRLSTKLEVLKSDIAAQDATIAAAVAPYLPVAGKLYGQNENPAAVPTPDMVAPGAVSQRTVLLEELTKTLEQSSQLELSAKLKVTSEIVQKATLPTVPTGGSKGILLPLGLVGGAILGAIVAAFVARLSPSVLDAGQASQILGQPVVGSFARTRSFVKQPLVALTDLPSVSTPVINELCVRAEGNAKMGRPLTVAVVGTQRNAGTTTLAIAMAGRFGNNGAKVLLIDADTRRSVMSRLFRTTPQTSIPKMISELTSTRTSASPVTKGTSLAEVSVVGVGDKSESNSLRRDTIAPLLEAASHYAEVIVIDGGPVLDAATTLHLCNVVDAIVLAIPIKHQRSAALTVVRQQLAGKHGILLPALTHPSKRRMRKNESESTAFVRGDDAVTVELETEEVEAMASRRSR